MRSSGGAPPIHSSDRESSDVNARADIDAGGVGGQTPIYPAVTQFGDWGMSVARILLEAGAGRSIRATLPGSYESSVELVTGPPLEYAQRFPGPAFSGSNGGTLDLLATWRREPLSV